MIPHKILSILLFAGLFLASDIDVAHSSLYVSNSSEPDTAVSWEQRSYWPDAQTDRAFFYKQNQLSTFSKKGNGHLNSAIRISNFDNRNTRSPFPPYRSRTVTAWGSGIRTSAYSVDEIFNFWSSPIFNLQLNWNNVGIMFNDSSAFSLSAVIINSYIDLSHISLVSCQTFWWTLNDGKTESNPVPLPAAFLLFGSGLAGLAGLRKFEG